jgi:hypothetical protein
MDAVLRDLGRWDWTPVDQDQDGRLDLFSYADRGMLPQIPPAAFWRNEDDGFRDVAAEWALDTEASAMGHGAADFNGDGRLDHCVTDVNDTLTCLMSAGLDDTFYEAGAALGLVADRTQHPAWQCHGDDTGMQTWVGWGLELIDLDNDGHLDAAATGAPTPNSGDPLASNASLFQPHWLWRGQPDGSFKSSFSGGFLAEEWAWGLASADLDGDGTRELITAPWQGAPEVWDNGCSAGHWLELHVDAPGATVEVTAGGRTWLSLVPTAKGGGQSPAAVHVGLGTIDTVDEVVVRWPTRAVTTLFSIEVDETTWIHQPR